MKSSTVSKGETSFFNPIFNLFCIIHSTKCVCPGATGRRVRKQWPLFFFFLLVDEGKKKWSHRSKKNVFCTTDENYTYHSCHIWTVINLRSLLICLEAKHERSTYWHCPWGTETTNKRCFLLHILNWCLFISLEYIVSPCSQSWYIIWCTLQL